MTNRIFIIDKCIIFEIPKNLRGEVLRRSTAGPIAPLVDAVRLQIHEEIYGQQYHEEIYG